MVLGKERHHDLLEEFSDELSEKLEDADELIELIEEYEEKLPEQLTQHHSRYSTQIDWVTEVMIFIELGALEVEVIEDVPDYREHEKEFEEWKEEIHHNDVQLHEKFELKKFWELKNWKFSGNEQQSSVGIADITGEKQDGTHLVGEAGPCRMNKPVKIGSGEELHHHNTRTDKIYIYRPTDKFEGFKERVRGILADAHVEAFS